MCLLLGPVGGREQGVEVALVGAGRSVVVVLLVREEEVPVSGMTTLPWTGPMLVLGIASRPALQDLAHSGVLHQAFPSLLRLSQSNRRE